MSSHENIAALEQKAEIFQDLPPHILFGDNADDLATTPPKPSEQQITLAVQAGHTGGMYTGNHRYAQDADHDGVNDKDKKEEKNARTARQMMSVNDTMNSLLPSLNDLSIGKDGYLTGTNGQALSYEEKLQIEEENEICLNGRAHDEIDPETGEAYVVDAKTGTDTFNFEDFQREMGISSSSDTTPESALSAANEDGKGIQAANLRNAFQPAHDGVPLPEASPALAPALNPALTGMSVSGP